MQKEFKDIVKALKEAKRLRYIHDFALTGALALSALSQPRATRDIDVLISIEEDRIKGFVEWLKSSKEFRLTKHHVGRPKDHIKDLIEVPIRSIKADIIVASSEVEKEAVKTALAARTYNIQFRVVLPEYLIVLKLLAGSDQDYIDGAQLWKEDIDKAMVRRMVKKLFMEGKLKKLISIAKRLP